MCCLERVTEEHCPRKPRLGAQQGDPANARGEQAAARGTRLREFFSSDQGEFYTALGGSKRSGTSMINAILCTEANGEVVHHTRPETVKDRAKEHWARQAARREDSRGREQAPLFSKTWHDRTLFDRNATSPFWHEVLGPVAPGELSGVLGRMGATRRQALTRWSWNTLSTLAVTESISFEKYATCGSKWESYRMSSKLGSYSLFSKQSLPSDLNNLRSHHAPADYLENVDVSGERETP